MQHSYLTGIKNWMNKPFPFYTTYKQKILIPTILTFFVMIGIVMLNWTTDYDILWKQITGVLTYGSIVLFVTIVFSLVLPEILPEVFDAEKWNVLKTLVYILLTLFTIGLTITIIAYHFDNPQDVNFLSFFIAILIRSVALSFFPIILIVFYFEGMLHKKNHLTALKMIDEINKGKHHEQPGKNSIFTFAKKTKEEIHIDENDLIYIKAEGNYCSLNYKKNAVVLRKLIRSSMKEVEMCMNKSGNFMRCHKSYIVNVSKISDVTGNARGYVFHLANDEYKIPGSRNLSKAFIHSIKTFQND